MSDIMWFFESMQEREDKEGGSLVKPPSWRHEREWRVAKALT